MWNVLYAVQQQQSSLYCRSVLSCGPRWPLSEPHNMQIPYSGKLLREKTFANFADLCSATKVFSANFLGCGTHAHALCQCPHPCRLVKLFHESFLRRIFIFANSRKFSPLKVSHYTVCETVSTIQQQKSGNPVVIKWEEFWVLIDLIGLITAIDFNRFEAGESAKHAVVAHLGQISVLK